MIYLGSRQYSAWLQRRQRVIVDSYHARARQHEHGASLVTLRLAEITLIEVLTCEQVLQEVTVVRPGECFLRVRDQLSHPGQDVTGGHGRGGERLGVESKR